MGRWWDGEMAGWWEPIIRDPLPITPYPFPIIHSPIQGIGLRGFDAIVLFNAGVKLVAADSPVLTELKLLEERGVDLIPCGTCLQHFGVTPAVGKVGDMDAIVRELDRAAKVITL